MTKSTRGLINQEYYIWYHSGKRKSISFYDWCKSKNLFDTPVLYGDIDDEEEKAKIRQEVEDLVKEISDLA